MPTPTLRRPDRAMADAAARELLGRAYCGRLATVGPDGHPYCIPLLHVLMDGRLYVHNAAARGHLRTNVEHDPRVCFEVDEPGEVFAYGRYECDSSVAYRSVVVFGTARIVEDPGEKRRFCEALMAKYGNPDWDRPKGFFPRLEQIAVYAITIARLSGKENALPAASERWPAADHTKTPDARPAESLVPGRVEKNQQSGNGE